MNPPPSLPPSTDALFKRALALQAGERENFLAEHVPDESQRLALARRLAEQEQTLAWGSTHPAKIANQSDPVQTDGPTEVLDQGSTEHAASSAPSSLDSDYATLPTIEAQGGGESRENRGGPIGQIGGYELLEEIARGGMGVVFKARHRVLDRLVAIKIPRAAQLEDEGEVRFLREARAAAQLRHPHVCPIYEVGYAGRQPFIALGFIDGPTLRQKLSEKVTAREAAEIMAKVARAVHYAHQRGVIHRDIKPSNIMLEHDSCEPVLMDFGLAKQLSEGDSHVTKSGQVMGTPVYMAPEQAAGRHEDIGPLTDVYSLGAVLYEMLTGRPPFQGATGEVIRQVQTDEPPAPRKLAPTIHRDLETICLKAMAKSPAARYATAQALAEDLERFAAGEAILAKREGLARYTLRALRRNGRLVAAVLLMAVIGTGVAGYFALGARKSARAAEINRQLNQALQAAEWDEAHRRQMESLAMQLAAYDPPAAEAMRAQISRSFAGRIRSQIANSIALSERDFQRIQGDISWLGERDAKAAPPLQQKLAARRRTWQEIVRLSPPYDNLDQVFADAAASPTEAGLKRRSGQGESSVRLTSVASAGNVRLTAQFAADWKTADEVGLLLHATPKTGYLFRLSSPPLATAPSPDQSTPPSTPFWRHMEAGSDIEMEMLRDGLLLRRISVRANDVVDQKTGHLTLEVTAEGERLTFRAGRQPALVFEDTFPYVGGANQRFGALWPAQASLLSLAAMQQPLPVAPSPLEEGDQLFAQEQWSAAISQYRQQAGVAGDERLRDRARFKEALCLVRLRDDAGAVKIFESLAATPDERLRVLAGCQLWLMHLKHTRYDEAEMVFESLRSKYQFEQLAILVPETDRREIIGKTYGATVGLNLYRFTEEDLRFLEQAHRVRQLLNPHERADDRGIVTWQYLRGLHLAGEIDRGIKLVREYLAQGIGLNTEMTTSIISECSWMLRQQGRLGEARELIDQRLGKREEADNLQQQLLVERARISAAEGNWEAVADDLDFFLSGDACHLHYREFSAACLMRGLLHQRASEMEQAAQLWRRGLYENWLAEIDRPNMRNPSLSGMQAANEMLLSALCGDLPEKQVTKLLTQSFPLGSTGMTAQLVNQYTHILAPAMNNLGKSDRGKEVIWRSAFQEVPLRQLIRDPAYLIFLEVTRQGAAPGDWSPEEEQLVWDMTAEAFDLYTRDEIGMPQAVQIVLTWKGANNLFGWKGVAPSLEPSLRGPTAYVFGHRFLKLGKEADAREFFQSALADAQNSSPLKKLAAAKLAEMAKPSANK